MKFFRDYILPRLESGQYINCEKQVEFELQPKCICQGKTILPITYVADFVVTEKDEHVIVFEYKGFADNTAKLKAKIFKYKYPDIDYRWICHSLLDSDGKDGGWVLYEKVVKGRAERKKNKKLSEGLD